MRETELVGRIENVIDVPCNNIRVQPPRAASNGGNQIFVVLKKGQKYPPSVVEVR